MQLQTFSYNRRGWSLPAFPAMDSPETMVLVFGSGSFLEESGALRELSAAYPQSRFLGCSTAGEIMGASVNDESLSVAVARFEHTMLRPVAVTAGDSRAAGRQLASELVAPGLRGVLVFSDGTRVNGSELIRGMNEVLPSSVVVTGGLAGDGSRFQRTWVLMDRAPQEGYISALGLYGDRLVLGHGSRGGWESFGPERAVTKSAGNVLYELDGKPALALYKQYLGERASGLPSTALLFPLGLRVSDGEDGTLVRTILGVDEAAQSMTFAGDLPQGGRVRLMRASFDRLIGGAAEAGRLSRTPLDTPNTLAVAVSCVGRRLVLGERVEDELEAALDALPPRAEMVGFYSYGELSPCASGKCELHNQTMTLTTFAER